MPRLKANFVADWTAYLREHMVNIQGWSADQIAAFDDRDVPIFHFEASRRRVVPTPRTIKTADDFVCQPVDQAGWNTLQDKVWRGEDINPHLSKKHAFLMFSDGLLAEWGVHHFHLGIVPDPKKIAYMGRTARHLYALVTDDALCAINIYPHQSYEDNSVLESIHRNWPELISRYRVMGVTGEKNLTSDQRRALRPKNGNVLTTLADGTVYMPISGGVMSSGVNSEAVKLADYWQMRIDGLQNDFETRLDELLPALRKSGYAEEPEIDAQLEFSNDGVQVFFPKYSVLAILSIREKEP